MAIDIGAVFAGAVITETVFGWDGMGFDCSSRARLRIDLLLAWLMVTGIFVVLFNLAADPCTGCSTRGVT